jgi:ABC-type amino acid transport substrate-binding protein
MEFLFDIYVAVFGHPSAEGLYAYCKANKEVAFILAFLLIVIIIAILFSSISELWHVIWRAKNTWLGILGIGVVVSIVVVLSGAGEYYTIQRLKPRPAFVPDQQTTFIREPVVLKWTYSKAKVNEHVVYQIEVADNRDFSENVNNGWFNKIYGWFNKISNPEQPLPTTDEKPHFHETDGTTWPSYTEGSRWWRVRAVDSSEPDPRWSEPIQTTYYSSAYARIMLEGKLTVYVSSEISLGIFKFYAHDNAGLSNSNDPRGVDPDVVDAILQELKRDREKLLKEAEKVKEAPTLEQNYKPEKVKLLHSLNAEAESVTQYPKISANYVPIAWEDLFDQPRKGTADIIISAITDTPERATKYHLTFSDPYFCTGHSLLYRKKDESLVERITTMHDRLKKKRVAYEEGTTTADLVNLLVSDPSPSKKAWGANFLTKKPLGEAEEIIQRLLSDHPEIDFGIMDTAFAMDRLFSLKNDDIRIMPFSADIPAEVVKKNYLRWNYYAVAVNENDAVYENDNEGELVKTINRAIAKLTSPPAKPSPGAWLPPKEISGPQRSLDQKAKETVNVKYPPEKYPPKEYPNATDERRSELSKPDCPPSAWPRPPKSQD